MIGDEQTTVTAHRNDQLGTKTNRETDLKEIFDVVWAAKIPIFAFTVFCALLSIWYALSIPNQYKAVAVLAPAQQQSGGLSNALGQLGGLASLAGVNMGSGGVSEFEIAKEIMQSWSFIDEFINHNQLEVDIYGVHGWDQSSNRPQHIVERYDIKKQQWLIKSADGTQRAPTSWELFSTFSDKLSVSESKTTGLVTISIEYYAPQLAKRWLDMYVDAINQHMQLRKMAKVTSNIEYLQAQIEKTSIAEMKEVFYTIIQEQIKNKMLAEASPEYVFVAVNPSMLPEEKSQPKRALICVVGALIGGILSVLFILVTFLIREKATF